MPESKYVQMPFYFVLSIIFSLAVWSLLFPHLFGNNESASAATFASPTTVTSTVPSTSKTKLLSVDGVYYLAFTSTSTVSTSLKSVYITTSSNAGNTWSTPVKALDLLGVYPGAPTQEPVEFGFVYNSFRREFAMAGALDSNANVRNIVFTTSSNAFAWSATSTIVNDTGSGYTNPGPKTPLAFSSTTGMYALGFVGNSASAPGFYIATSTNGLTWTSSTFDTADTETNISNDWKIDVIEVNVLGNQEIHVVYDTAVSGTRRFYQVLYATSTNAGNSWTTTTISGRVNTPAPASNIFTMRDMTRATINHDGRASVIFYDLITYNSSGAGAASGTIVYGHRSNTTSLWTTTTLDTEHRLNSLAGQERFHASALHYYASDMAALAYYSDASSEGGSRLIEFFAMVTNTTFTDTGSITFGGQPQFYPSSQISIAYITSTQSIAFAYVDAQAVKFTTSSLRSVDFNGVSTSTPIMTGNASTTGSGKVTVTTTVTDSDGDTTNLTVQYSTDGGSTWSNATIGSVSVGTGSIATSSGRIVGLTGTQAGNAVVFVWDSATDLPSFETSTARVRIRPEDAYGNGLYSVTAANFEVDNLAPSSTTFALVDPATNSTTIYWAGKTDASTYTVSSTVSSTYTVTASSTTLTSLTPNVQYSYQIRVIDNYNNSSTYSAVTSTYTDAAVPASVTAAVVDSHSITVSWGANSNGTSTVYQVYNVTAGSAVATTQATQYQVDNLTRNTSYQFQVRAQFLQDTSQYSDYSATTTAVSTLGGGSDGGGGGGGGGGGSPNASKPSVTKTVEVGAPTPVSVGGMGHTVTVSKANATQATVTIQSDPITVTLAKGELQELDTDKDGVKDLRVTYQGLDAGKPKLSFIALVDLSELKNQMTINKGSYETSNKSVTLTFNTSNFTVSKAEKMSVSEVNDFTKVALETFTPTKQWTLSEGIGKKTVYVKLRLKDGSSVVISDSIHLIQGTTDKTTPPVDETPNETDETPNETPNETDETPNETDTTPETAACPLDVKSAYKATNAAAVYYITEDCEKRPFTNPQKFFSYFTSWSVVHTTSASVLNSIPNDKLGFMPWGPLWKPQWGAIVKHPGDPKVYLLLNNEKYWITSETVYESLYTKNGWGWIEDVDPKLLDNYATGSEINYTDHHPNYTVIKYGNSPKVYRLEPDSSGKQVKRHIKNESAFNKLGFRWDRIVILKDSETYTDGASLE